jgi:hypothetical protein
MKQRSFLLQPYHCECAEDRAARKEGIEMKNRLFNIVKKPENVEISRFSDTLGGETVRKLTF